ncbi:uncharacterized protein BKA78DRAFT_366486 [Phyllosticta capitalensis]|uniref:Uncharacterized protein n=1 Tax=Phyllosticta capitalensis TaxID=121624 RepID=A0ABR1YUB9_9PEZI
MFGGNVGVSHVVNHCNYSVTVWLSGDRSEFEQIQKTLDAETGVFEYPYMQKDLGGGMSIKIRRNDMELEKIGQQASLMQFEYKASPDGNGSTVYDISNVNCGGRPDETMNAHYVNWEKDLTPESCPFWRDGFVLDVEDDNCWNVPCFPGAEMCTNAYYLSNDDTLDDVGGQLLNECPGNGFNMTLHLCPCRDLASPECYLAAQGGDGYYLDPNTSHSAHHPPPKTGFPTTPIDTATVQLQTTLHTHAKTTSSTPAVAMSTTAPAAKSKRGDEHKAPSSSKSSADDDSADERRHFFEALGSGFPSF